MASDYSIEVVHHGEYVAVVTFERPPLNFFTAELVGALASAIEELGIDGRTRAVLLRARGRHFCAGAQFGEGRGAGNLDVAALYREGARFFAQPLPIVAQLQGSVVGGGLGLALAADFRVGASNTRIAANFARIGLHHGFGLSVTLPRLVGPQRARDLLLTGRTVSAEEALSMGLCDAVADVSDVDPAALDMATMIASNAPLAVRAIRATLDRGLIGQITAATQLEHSEQRQLFATDDFAEGVAAARRGRAAVFRGR
jgi:2-(1,2-epoxy-1,2-dihydrophenyl)acetyl-CoA isomerase